MANALNQMVDKYVKKVIKSDGKIIGIWTKFNYAMHCYKCIGNS